MSLFMIDQRKCKRDGLCVKDCPVQVIAMEDKDAFPSPIEDAEEFCVKCGHCVAICPHGALTLSTMPLDACPPPAKRPTSRTGGHATVLFGETLHPPVQKSTSTS